MPAFWYILLTTMLRISPPCMPKESRNEENKKSTSCSISSTDSPRYACKWWSSSRVMGRPNAMEIDSFTDSRRIWPKFVLDFGVGESDSFIFRAKGNNVDIYRGVSTSSRNCYLG